MTAAFTSLLGKAGLGAAAAEGATVAAPAAARGATVAGEAAVEGATASSFSKNLAQGMAKQAVKSVGTGPSQQPGQREGQGVEQNLNPVGIMNIPLPDTRAMPSTGSPELDAVRNAVHDVAGTAASVGKIGATAATAAL